MSDETKPIRLRLVNDSSLARRTRLVDAETGRELGGLIHCEFPLIGPMVPKHGILTAKIEVEICGLDVELVPEAVVFHHGPDLTGKQESEWALGQVEIHKLRKRVEETMHRATP